MTYQIAPFQDGWTKKDGAGFVHKRYRLCLALNGQPALGRFYNGGPRGGIGPRVSGKEPPEWMNRAARYVFTVGGVTAAQSAYVVEWFRQHRTGSPDAGFLVNLNARMAA